SFYAFGGTLACFSRLEGDKYLRKFKIFHLDRHTGAGRYPERGELHRFAQTLLTGSTLSLQQISIA
ncbi:MAG: hypothetical protein ACRC6G_14195, partial [Deefgea sp.]